MQVVQAPRASAIIYNILTSRADLRPWILPANICPIVPLTFFKACIPFEFVDISDYTLHMDLDQAEDLLKLRKYGGLLYAHTYGEQSTPDEFFKIVKTKYPDILLLDDRCLCLPEFESSADSQADVILYSTGYAKVVELNYGGFAFLKEYVSYKPSRLAFNVKDHDDIEKAYKQAIQNHKIFQYHDSDWLETDAQLSTWYDYRRQIENNRAVSLKHRTEVNNIYFEKLPLEIQLPRDYQNWRFNIRIKNNKQNMLDKIFQAHLFASSHYASLAGIMSVGSAPNAELLAKEVINLFNDHHFSISQAEMVSGIVQENLS